MCAGRRSSPGPHHMLFCSNQSHHSCRSSSGRRSTRRIGAPSPPTSRCARIRNQNLYTMTASRSPRSNFLVSLSCCNTHSAAPRAVRRNPERSTAGACPLLTCDSSPHGVSDAMHRSWRPTRSMWSGRTSLTVNERPASPVAEECAPPILEQNGRLQPLWAPLRQGRLLRPTSGAPAPPPPTSAHMIHTLSSCFNAFGSCATVRPNGS